MKLLAILGLVFALGTQAIAQCPSPQPKTIVMIGESTTFGLIENAMPSQPSPGEALQALLTVVPENCPWRDATVIDYGIPSTPTTAWTRTFEPEWCGFLSAFGQLDWEFFPLLTVACYRQEPFAAAITEAVGYAPDLVIVNAMGTNDAIRNLTPEQTAFNVSLVPSVSGLPTIIAPPFMRTDSTAQRQRVWNIRLAEYNMHILGGPLWIDMPLFDGVHQTAGWYAASAGAWIDFLCPQPGSEKTNPNYHP